MRAHPVWYTSIGGRTRQISPCMSKPITPDVWRLGGARPGAAPCEGGTPSGSVDGNHADTDQDAAKDEQVDPAVGDPTEKQADVDTSVNRGSNRKV